MSPEREWYLANLVEDDGTAWHAILDFALLQADKVELAVAASRRELPEAMTLYHAYQISDFRSRWRWRAQQLWESRFFQYRISPAILAYLKGVRRLTDWMFERPEDPSFFAGIQSVLWSISSEGLVFLHLSRDEMTQLREKGIHLEFWEPPV